MSQIECDCKNCPERNVSLTYNCHDHCPKYKAFQALCEKARENARRCRAYIPFIN